VAREPTAIAPEGAGPCVTDLERFTVADLRSWADRKMHVSVPSLNRQF
jgi:hypothetical protein